jgi:S1-C subfamily serine protease
MRNESDSAASAHSSASDLSAQLAVAAEMAGAAVVTVEARHRIGSSGVVWSAGGVVVTANHTVERDEEIAVVLPGGERLPATLAGRDAATDLAALRVEGVALASPEWSDLSALMVGHLVLSLGRPARHLRASLGVVSDLRAGWRTPAGGRVDRYLQADSGLQRGFSGSLLVDVRGRALGLNTSGLLRGRAIALPAATIARVVESLLSHGRVRRGFLGIGASPVRLPPRLEQQFGQATALMVLAVQPDSPAERAGLLLGDVVLAFDGHATTDIGQLHARLQEEREGAAAELKLMRAGEVRQIAVTLATR